VSISSLLRNAGLIHTIGRWLQHLGFYEQTSAVPKRSHIYLSQGAEFQVYANFRRVEKKKDPLTRVEGQPPVSPLPPRGDTWLDVFCHSQADMLHSPCLLQIQYVLHAWKGVCSHVQPLKPGLCSVRGGGGNQGLAEPINSHDHCPGWIGFIAGWPHDSCC
jgi:hypothetical protein